MTQQTALHSKTNIVNGVDIDTLMATVKTIQANPELGKSRFSAYNTWIAGSKNASRIGNFHAAGEEHTHKRDFVFNADEPTMLAGYDDNANPVEYLLHALASCVTTSMVAHAAVRGIHIEELESHLEGDIDLNGFLGIDPATPKGYTNIRVNFRVKGDVDVDVLRELAEFSPVYRTITNGAKVDINIINV